VNFKIKDLLALLLSLWLGCGLMPLFADTPDGGKNERISDSAFATINTSKGTVAVHQSLNDESRFYIVPHFKFLTVNAKGDIARRSATIKDKTEVLMKLQFAVPAVRREVAKALEVKKIWKVGNLPVNAIRVNLKSDSLGKMYGVEKAYKVDYPAYAQDLDVVFTVASDKADEFIRDVNRGNVDFKLIYAFNQINIDSHYEELPISFIRDSLLRLIPQGKELMTAVQMADMARTIRHEITSKVITSLGGKIEPHSISVKKLMSLFEIGDIVQKTEDELADFDKRLYEQLNLRVNPRIKPENFQPFRVQKYVVNLLNIYKNVALQRKDYVRDYKRFEIKWSVSANACAIWGRNNISGSYVKEAKKVRGMSDEAFRKFVAKSHGLEYDTEKNLFQGVKIYDTQKIIKASDDLKGLSVTVKPTLTSGVKHLDLRPESQTAKGLVAYYPFDGDAKDHSGKGHHGIVEGSATLTEDKSGKPNSAYYFDGSSKIVVNSLNQFPKKDDKFAVSVWFKRTGQWDNYQGIVNNGYYDNGSWEIRMGHESQGTKLGGGIATEKSPDQWDYILYASQNEWHHVVMSYDGISLSFYLDGVAQSAERTDKGNIIVKNNPLTIGQAGIGAEDNYFFGVIDEVRIYNRPLSHPEIQNLCQCNK